MEPRVLRAAAVCCIPVMATARVPTTWLAAVSGPSPVTVGRPGVAAVLLLLHVAGWCALC